MERCWGILELHWNETKLVDVETMLEWAKSRTWQGMHPGEWPPLSSRLL